MWVKFEYDRQRPFLEIQLVNGNKSFNALGLVDSGAGMTLADADIAKVLEIDENMCAKKPVGGITGSNVDGFVANLDLYVKYLPDVITIPVLFVPKLRVGVLLGHDGFFDSYRIKFQTDSRSFEIARSLSNQYEKK